MNSANDIATLVSRAQCSYKPAPDVCSINGNPEPLAPAEVSGAGKIRAAAEGMRTGSLRRADGCPAGVSVFGGNMIY